jgi:DNA-binding CsgD family transcriptional regulator
VAFFRWEDVAAQQEVLEYFRGYDSSWTITHSFDAVHEVVYQLIGSRGRGDPPFDEDDGLLIKQLGAHFRRAIALRREILRARLTSEFQADGLDRLGIGGILAAQNGRMSLLNQEARNLVAYKDGLRFHNERLHAVDGHEDRRLQSAIREVLTCDGERPLTRAMTVTRQSGLRNLGLVVSGRRSISLISGRPEINALIFMRDTDSAADLDLGLVQQLFNFTRAEAALAAGLAKGMCLEELERKHNIRHNTARAHLRSMFLKADVNRQSELVHLLANSVAPLGSSR